MSKILLVEDDADLADFMRRGLSAEGHVVDLAKDGPSALDMARGNDYPLIVLDRVLPGLDGVEICKVLRREGRRSLILMLTAKDSLEDKIEGLRGGVDDYLTKPFSMRELVARCRALLRRQRLSALPLVPVLQYKEVTLNPQECRVTVRGVEVNLSPKEFRLLELFISYARRVWSREQLLDHVWGPDFVGDSKTVDVHIRWLREKLEQDPSRPEYIVTVRGFGYRFG